MKFGKEFASQMVPEWQDAYINYEFLKTIIKQIQVSVQKTKPEAKRTRTLYRAFSGLLQGRNSPRNQPSEDIENQAVLLESQKQDGAEGGEITFIREGGELGEHEVAYFKCLNDEFNKVLKFNTLKVGEVMKEAAVLDKQMRSLVSFRAQTENRRMWENSLEESSELASDVAASTAALSATTPSAAKSSNAECVEENATLDIENLTEQVETGEFTGERDEETHTNVHEQKENGINSTRPEPIQTPENVKLNINNETPRSTIKGILQFSNKTELNFSKENLRKAEELLKKSFIEFYKKLRLLKSYSLLNVLAFTKIMKKYDKISSRSASHSFMKMVDNSSLRNSDEVVKLMERVEFIFIKHFSNSNRRKGMNILRPKVKKERHMVSFSMGFLVGCTIALLLGLVLIIRARNILYKEGRILYMETLFPLYSLFGFIILHIMLYGGNLYLWRRYRVNYSFIFSFKQGTELGYRDILFLGFCLTALSLACVLANLDMEMDPVTQDYVAITELLPLGLVVIVIAILLCPLNIFYRSSRFFLLLCLFRTILAPLYKVSLQDFFLADQLTSQVQAFRSLEFYVCYYGWGDYKLRKNSCNTNHAFNTFSFIVAGIPYWWRFLQCLRRMVEEKDVKQGYNGFKYFLTIVAVCTRTAYTLNRGVGWKFIAWITSIFVTIFSAYWDIVMDWGLFQRNSKNRWLRDKLLIPHKSVYFLMMVLNVLLRLAWMQTVMNFTIFSLHRQSMITIVASLEIIRRSIWNFFRLENEHLNNVGKYRAFKTVALPFHYDEDDDKYE